MTFRLRCAAGEEQIEAEKLDLFGSSRGAAGCAGQCPALVLGQVLISKVILLLRAISALN